MFGGKGGCSEIKRTVTNISKLDPCQLHFSLNQLMNKGN